MYCKYCGAQVDSDAKFCSSCGKELFDEAAQQSQSPQAAPASQQNVPQYAQSKSAGGGIREFFLACWNGEKSLVFTFWVILFGLNVVFGTLGESESYYRWTSSLSPIPALLLCVAVLGIVVFQCVSVWRSAGRYTGWAGWKIIARIFVGVNIVTNTLQFLVDFVNAL